jgi:hypothetical protein
MWRRDCDNDIAIRPQGPEDSVGCRNQMVDVRGKKDGWGRK